MGLQEEIDQKITEIKSDSYSMSIGELINLYKDKEIEIHPEFQRFFRTCSIQWEKAINTQSNLSSVVFREIVCTLGLDYSIYETKENLIDETLLRSRNEIAHGKDLLIGYEQYIELHNEVINLMTLFFNQIDNAAKMKSYLYSHGSSAQSIPIL